MAVTPAARRFGLWPPNRISGYDTMMTRVVGPRNDDSATVSPPFQKGHDDRDPVARRPSSRLVADRRQPLKERVMGRGRLKDR